MFILYFVFAILYIVCIKLYDVFINSVINDEDDIAMIVLSAIIWPIATLIFLLILLNNSLNKYKKKRIEREVSNYNIRIKFEQEQAQYLKEVEEELKLHNKTKL